MTDEEVRLILHAVEEITLHHRKWAEDYLYLANKNEYIHRSHVDKPLEDEMMDDWFSM